MESKKATSSSTVELQGSIDKRPEYHPETRGYWVTQVDVCACGDRDTQSIAIKNLDTGEWFAIFRGNFHTGYTKVADSKDDLREDTDD